MTEREWSVVIVGIVALVILGLVLYVLSQVLTFLQQNPAIAVLAGVVVIVLFGVAVNNWIKKWRG